MPAVAGAQGAVVEGIWEEVVHQGAEGHAVAPAGREVLDLHVLSGAWEGGTEEGSEGGRRREIKRDTSVGRDERVKRNGNISKVGAGANAAGGAGGLARK